MYTNKTAYIFIYLRYSLFTEFHQIRESDNLIAP